MRMSELRADSHKSCKTRWLASDVQKGRNVEFRYCVTHDLNYQVGEVAGHMPTYMQLRREVEGM